MPAHMIGHEGGNEVVAMVIAGLATESERDACLRACTLQQFRAKLFRQERISIAYIDQKIGKPGAVLDQKNRIMLTPGIYVVAQVACQRLDAPGDLRGGCDRRKGAGGPVAPGGGERDRQ